MCRWTYNNQTKWVDVDTHRYCNCNSWRYRVQIRPRSGLAAKSSISVLNTPGTIDSDYRGELKIILFNHGKDEFTVNDEDRVAQMVLMPILKVEIEETNELPETIRGSGGFGSTGK